MPPMVSQPSLLLHPPLPVPLAQQRPVVMQQLLPSPQLYAKWFLLPVVPEPRCELRRQTLRPRQMFAWQLGLALPLAHGTLQSYLSSPWLQASLLQPTRRPLRVVAALRRCPRSACPQLLRVRQRIRLVDLKSLRRLRSCPSWLEPQASLLRLKKSPPPPQQRKHEATFVALLRLQSALLQRRWLPQPCPPQQGAQVVPKPVQTALPS
mmetsp:Transcript_47135/g.109854  ORF Transcript_47135/g.109854 Transcript_47135/m.109854 type:complete len:208 (+) Transcript_47135:1209-1832(+)